MGEHRRVNTRIWTDEKFKTLGAQGKLLLLYLLTSDQTNAMGLYRLSLGRAEEDLRLSNVQATFARVQEVMGSALEYDAESGLLWLPNWLRYNWPRSPNVVRSWARELTDYPDCDLLHRWAAKAGNDLARRNKAYGRAFDDLVAKVPALSPKDFADVSRKSSGKTSARGGDQGGVSNPFSDPNNGSPKNKKDDPLHPSRDGGGLGGGVQIADHCSASPSGRQESLPGSHPLAGKTRYTGQHPLWFDWREYAFVWASVADMVEAEEKWRRRYPHVQARAYLCGYITEWMEGHPSKGRRRRNLLRWVGQVWLAPKEETLARSGPSRATEAGKQMEQEEDGWDGIAQA